MVKRIIIVDDEYSISGSLFQYLSKKGYDVVVLTNGAWITEGLIRTECVDIVVTDYYMGKINGNMVIESLRNGGYKGKIILASSVNISMIKELDIDAVVEKPFTLDEISRVIEEVCTGGGCYVVEDNAYGK